MSRLALPTLWLPDRLAQRREDERLLRGLGGLSRRWMPGYPCCCGQLTCVACTGKMPKEVAIRISDVTAGPNCNQAQCDDAWNRDWILKPSTILEPFEDWCAYDYVTVGYPCRPPDYFTNIRFRWTAIMGGFPATPQHSRMELVVDDYSTSASFEKVFDGIVDCLWEEDVELARFETTGILSYCDLSNATAIVLAP